MIGGNANVEDDGAMDYTVEQVGEGLEQTVEEEATLRLLRLCPLSFHGFDSPRTMKLIGGISDYKVLTMIDSGASHCLI